MKENIDFEFNNTEENTVSIIFVGDTSPNEGFEQSMINGGSNIYNQELVQVLESANYRICNLESVLWKEGKK